METEERPEIEWVALDSVQLNPRNPRLNDKAVQAVAASIRRFGFRQPIVVNRRTHQIEAGNTRWKAAKSLGLTQIPVLWADDDELVALAYTLADNRSHELSVWDEPELAALLQRLDEAGRLADSLFDQAAMGQLLARLDGEDRRIRQEISQVPPLSAGPTRVQPGELWQLGRHRLLCGDAMDADNWQRLMEDKVAQAICTDPPYAVSYVGARAAQQERISARRRGLGQPADAYWDEMSAEQYSALLKGALALAHQHSDDQAPLYLWFAVTHLRTVLDCLAACGWQERNLLVWAKNNGAGALFAQYKHWYEPCFYAHKRGQTPRWHGPSNERTVWEHDKPVANDLHPTMKPLALIERSIQNATEPGQIVVDAFMGSGTCIIAAERTGRIAYGFDLDPRYCDIMLTRWERFTGEQAIRIA